MIDRRILSTLFLLALGCLAALSLLSGCEKTPSAPVFNNIFDPAGPDGGNPMQLTATLSDTSILLSWTQPQGFGISYYELSHSLEPASGFLPIGTADHSEGAFGTLRFDNPAPTMTHYFRIQAFDLDGNFTNLADQTPASRRTPPLVMQQNGTSSVASRMITLLVTVGAGDTLRLSNDRLFAEESRIAVAEIGQAQEISWQLPASPVNDTTFTVRVLAEMGTSVSDTAKLDLTVDFAPAFTVEGDPTTVASRRLSLAIPTEGVTEMRFADTEANLDLQSWRPAAESYPYILNNSANTQEIWGQFRSDFGFQVTGTLTVVPDLLEDATFALDLPEDHISDELLVGINCQAVARFMRFSENLNFFGVPWVNYADTSFITLSSTPGQKTIYGQFRNDWAESGILTDYVIYLSQPLDVSIFTPADGDSLTSGQSFLVLGVALGPSGSAGVDSVKFDGGDGQGFVDVVGVSSWSYLWDIPAQETDTDRVIRARAWAADDSVTTSVTVTLQATSGQGGAE